MTTKVELITPKIATEILENHNPRNRTISEGTVSSYALDMKNGKWTLHHQGLAFDEKGDLIDGQHRLWAIIFSGCSIEFSVTRGIPVEQSINGTVINSMDNIDRGRVRSVGSQMALSHNIKNGSLVAGVCRTIAGIITEPNGCPRGRITFSNSMYIHGVYGNDIDSVFLALDAPKRKPSLMGPLAMYHHGKHAETMEFCRQLVSLEGITAPVKILLRWMESNHTSSNLTATVRICAKCIHAFNDGVNKGERFTDDTTGLKFLLSMFPSANKRIADQLKPVKIISTSRRQIHKIFHAK